MVNPLGPGIPPTGDMRCQDMLSLETRNSNLSHEPPSKSKSVQYRIIQAPDVPKLVFSWTGMVRWACASAAYSPISEPWNHDPGVSPSLEIVTSSTYQPGRSTIPVGSVQTMNRCCIPIALELCRCVISKVELTQPLASGPPKTPKPVPLAPFGTGADEEIFQLYPPIGST